MTDNPPVICWHCGLIFSSLGFDVGIGRGIKFSNCQEECPQCGEIAQVVDGVYGAVNDLARYIAAHQKAQEWRRVAEIADEVRQRRMTPEQAQEEIGLLTPEFAALMLKLGKFIGPYARFVLLFFLLKVSITYDATSAIEDIFNIQRQYENINQD